VALTPEYEAALDTLTRAADAMTRACAEYQEVLRATPTEQNQSPTIAALRKACDDARSAHDEALADVWEMIEDQP
jgi:hypothetical protein